MPNGYFKAFVTTVYEAKPVPEALVQVYSEDLLLRELLSDENGLTDIVPLNAPLAEYSLDPDNSCGTPYSTYNVKVYAEGYREVQIKGVQVFPDILSVLPVEMEPLPLSKRGEEGADIIEIEIPEPAVLTRAANDADVPREGLAPQVLSAVVIPENITVHLGRPDASARNVTVSFPNYIKNVCCSEIYPTWPDAALRANIYCQISLVLNRVFTEWYRGRGYAFDITNSTSYDQYFVYGRNIYDNVSKIVDEIFDIYMRKANYVEPFYAEYCNGTTATCPGLKQWGTVTLANQGYSAIGILRYYYGNQINLYSAPVVEGIPTSWGSVNLRVGSSGSAVATVQTQLQRIRRNYPLIPDIGTVDSIYGSRTEAAVRTFQNIFNLTVDGVVGKRTWYKIGYIYTAVKKLAELTSEGIQSENVPPAYPTVTIRQGSTGEYVFLAQFFLILASEFVASIEPIAMDGIYGPKTAEAVRDFQTAYGINADGIVGPVTWRALYDTYFGIMDAVNPTPAYPGFLIRYGSTGSYVSTIQRYLSAIGTYFSSIPSLSIDGIFGAGTLTAVTAFQRLFGLTADGIVGPLTWEAIVSVYNSLPD